MPFGAIKRALIRFARKVVQGVLSQLMQQLNVVQDQALAPMRQFVQAVMGGIWVGDGANAFVEEVSSLMIPGVGQVADHITTMHKNLQNACDVIDQADEQVNSKINGLADVFGAIYSG
ncbi:MAG: hypothetical protein HC875_34995 [Anaerolineales bacterium]|nr:hypothetical protein [Anaerolineales bacterium]